MAMARAPPLPPSPMTAVMIGVAQAGHLQQVGGDGERLAALLGWQGRIGAGRVHQGDDGQAELLGLLHQPERLAVPLRPRHPEAAVGVLLGVAPLLVAEHHDRPAVEAGRAADQGRIVGEEAVAVQLDVLLEDRRRCSRGCTAAGGGGQAGRAARRSGRRTRAGCRRREPARWPLGQGVQVGEALLGAGHGQAPFQAAAPAGRCTAAAGGRGSGAGRGGGRPCRSCRARAGTRRAGCRAAASAW